MTAMVITFKTLRNVLRLNWKLSYFLDLFWDFESEYKYLESLPAITMVYRHLSVLLMQATRATLSFFGWMGCFFNL